MPEGEPRLTNDPKTHDDIVLDHVFRAIVLGQNCGDALQAAAKEIKELRRVDGVAGDGESSDSPSPNPQEDDQS